MNAFQNQEMIISSSLFKTGLDGFHMADNGDIA